MPEDPVVHLRLPVDAFTGKLLNEHGDEVRHPRGFPGIDYRTTVVFAVEFLDRELAADLSWQLAAHPLDAERSYALSGGCDRSADASPMFLCDADKVNLPGDWPDGSDPDPALGRLTFRVAIDKDRFAAIAGNETLRKFCSMTVTAGSGSASAVAARIPFRPRKRADESAGGSGGGSGAATTVNGLSGIVVLADGDGNPLPVDGQTITVETGSRVFPDRNPVAQIPVLDAALGVCHILVATFTEISLSYPVWHLVEIRALVRSVNGAIVGTVIITPYIDEVAQTPVTINVGATWAAAVIPLVVETGAVRLVRTGGTLADGSWGGAAFRAITAMVTI